MNSKKGKIFPWVCLSNEIQCLLSKKSQSAQKFLRRNREEKSQQITLHKTLKQKSPSFSLTSSKGLKPVSVELLNPQVEGLKCAKRYSAPFVTMLGKPLCVREPPPRPPNIKLTHVSGTRPESSNFGGL